MATDGGLASGNPFRSLMLTASRRCIYMKEWVQQAHAFEYSAHELEYRWKAPKSWSWDTRSYPIKRSSPAWPVSPDMNVKAYAALNQRILSASFRLPVDDGWVYLVIHHLFLQIILEAATTCKYFRELVGIQKR